MQGRESGFGPHADDRERQDEARSSIRLFVDSPDGGEVVGAADAAENAERHQQRKTAEARHQQIDEAGAPVLRLMMMRRARAPMT